MPNSTDWLRRPSGPAPSSPPSNAPRHDPAKARRDQLQDQRDAEQRAEKRQRDAEKRADQRQREAERRAERRQQKEKNKTARTYRENAQTLDGKANSLRQALRNYGKNRRQQLQNINQRVGDARSELDRAFGLRLESLEGSASDNEMAAEASSNEALFNQGRERADALSEAATLGAGETDRLRAQAMSLRNWAANQGEVQRSQMDTLRSINASVGELNQETRTGLANISVSADRERAQVWNDFYNRRSETMTELGNVYGQQSEFYGKARELSGQRVGPNNRLSSSISRSGSGSGSAGAGAQSGGQSSGRGGPDFQNLSNRDAMRAARRESQSWYDEAARVAGNTYEDPGLRRWVTDFEGADDFETNNTYSHLGTFSGAMQAPESAEGATLRRW